MTTTRHIRGAALVCLAAADGTTAVEPPTEFRIFPAGSFETVYGPFTFDEESAKSVLAHREQRGVDVRLDYEHASEHVEEHRDPAEAAKAAGWFKCEVREGALWAANVKWTPPAAEKLRNGEFRYLSPTFLAEVETGRILLLSSVALTNNPGTIDAEPLVTLKATDRDPRDARRVHLALSFEDIHTRLRDAVRAHYSDAWVRDVFDEYVVFEATIEEDGKYRHATFRCEYTVTDTTITLDGDAVECTRQYPPVAGGKTMKSLLKALGLSDTATEAEAIVALNAKTAEATAKAAEIAGVVDATEAKLQELVALTGKGSPAEALGVIQAWKGAAEKVATLSAKVQELEAAKVEAEVVALVDGAVAEGKATPAQRDVLLSMGRKDVVSLKAFVEASPVIAPAAEAMAPATEAGETVALSAEELRLAKKMGSDPAKVLETKKKRLANLAARAES